MFTVITSSLKKAIILLCILRCICDSRFNYIFIGHCVSRVSRESICKNYKRKRKTQKKKIFTKGIILIWLHNFKINVIPFLFHILILNTFIFKYMLFDKCGNLKWNILYSVRYRENLILIFYFYETVQYSRTKVFGLILKRKWLNRLLQRLQSARIAISEISLDRTRFSIGSRSNLRDIPRRMHHQVRDQ